MTSPIQTATATLHTNRGDIKIALFGNHAPKTVANFVGLAQGTKDYTTENASGGTSGPFYDGETVFVDCQFRPGPPRQCCEREQSHPSYAGKNTSGRVCDHGHSCDSHR